MLPSREFYQPSGRVRWGRLVVALVLSLPLALLGAGLLCLAFRGGFYVLFLVPLFAGLLAGGTAWLTVSVGRCRNRWVGAAVGLLAGLVALGAAYQFDLAHEAGLGSLHRLDLLPEYVRLRVETDQLGHLFRTPPAPGQPIRLPRPAWAWIMFVMDGLCVALLPVALGWKRASRPFSEAEGRWLHEHLFYVEPEDARGMADALDREDAQDLAECAEPVPLAPASRRGEARLYYLPNERNSPVYLTLTIVDGRPWSHGWPEKLATRVLLTEDEAAALAEELRLPAAGFGVPEVQPVPDEPRRAAPAAAVEDLPPHEAGKVLNGRVFAGLTVIGLGPLALALLVAIGLVVYVSLHWADLGAGVKAGAAAFALMGLGGALAFTVQYGDYLPTRIQQRLLDAAIRQRPGALVQPGDPEALYVGVVPRKNWGRVMLETSEDIGLLKIDARRRELLFEGDRQRWRIPGDSIESCELDEYIIGVPDPNENNVFVLAVLRVSRGGEVWEAPLSPMRMTASRPTAEMKRQRCRQLRRRIRKELLSGPE